jgi:hypothetical protein
VYPFDKVDLGLIVWSSRMNGQWIGLYSGTNNGLIILELDDSGTTYDGTLMALNANQALPAMAGNVSAPKGQTKFTTRIQLQHSAGV